MSPTPSPTLPCVAVCDQLLQAPSPGIRLPQASFLHPLCRSVRRSGHWGHPGQCPPGLLHHPQAGARWPSAHLLHLLQPAQAAQLQQEERPPGEAALRHQYEHGLRALLAPATVHPPAQTPGLPGTFSFGKQPSPGSVTHRPSDVGPQTSL